MTRIRYKKDKSGVLSIDNMPGTHQLLSAIIKPTPQGFVWMVHGDDGNIISEGLVETDLKAKACVKRELKRLGVAFYDEIRKQGTTK